MGKSVLISGVGIISAIGDNVEETLHSLLESKTGVGKITILKTALSETHPAGEVKKTNDELRELAGLPGEGFYSRTTLLGMIAAQQALVSAKIDSVSDLRTG